ncbi:MAG TPA: chemotaxis protein CheW [Blastocatellia bacterium]|jgi:purine-binding chemotaxis protein CheW
MNRTTDDGQKKIDWGEIHRRLQMSISALEGSADIAPERKRAILKERARAIAQEIVPEDTNEERLNVVEFNLAYENYAVESRFVREVYPLGEYTPLPSTPSFVLGLINVRSQILSVLDIRRFFDLPERGLTDLNKVIIVRHRDIEVGLLADSIVGAREVRASEIQAALPTLTGIRAEFLKGITRERMTILDLEKILSDKRIIVREEVEE